MKLSIATIALLLASSIAQAQTPDAAPEAGSTAQGSEYLYQAPAKSWVVTPKILNTVGTYKFKSSSSYDKASTVSTGVSVEGEYGIADFFSLAAEAGFSAGVIDYYCKDSVALCTDATDRSRGLEDIRLAANFRLPMGKLALRFGADAYLSPGKRKIESDDDSNNFSGGQSVAPYLGLEVPVATSGFIGAKLQYEAVASKQKVTDDGATPKDYEVKPGKAFVATVFYEHRIAARFNVLHAANFFDPTADLRPSGLHVQGRIRGRFKCVCIECKRPLHVLNLRGLLQPLSPIRDA